MPNLDDLSRPTAGAPMRLWEGPAPLARGDSPADVPSLTPYWPLRPTADVALPAMVVCPGGGYGFLSPQEGEGFARYFSVHGIACFVLNYRLGSDGYRHPAMLYDAARALRTVRANAAAWGVDPDRVGIIGSSAGGHCAASLLTLFGPGDCAEGDDLAAVRSRPDFGVLCYPVITGGRHAHRGSFNNLLGDDHDEACAGEVSLETRVRAETPPTFIWHTLADQGVPVENALLFANALRTHGVPFDLHIYETGCHGLGLAEGHPWLTDCLRWLRARGVAPAPQVV